MDSVQVKSVVPSVDELKYTLVRKPFGH